MSDATKKMAKLVIPDGKSYDEGDGDAENGKVDDAAEEATETPAESNAEMEAQKIYDQAMEDDPQVCKALFELLKQKYEGEKETTKKEIATEKGDEMSDEGMPTD